MLQHMTLARPPQVVLVGNLPDFGEVLDPSVTNSVAAAAAGKGARLAYISDNNWGLDIALELEPGASPPPVFRYRYVVVDDNRQHVPISEAGSRDGRILNLGGVPGTYPSEMEIRDEWRHTQASIMSTSCFTKVIFAEPSREPKAQIVGRIDIDSIIVRLTVDSSRVDKGHAMGVIGSSTSLGQWEDGKVTVMSGANYPIWEADIVVKRSQFPLEYRYVIVDGSKKVQAVEQGDDCRRLQLGSEMTLDAVAANEANDRSYDASSSGLRSIVKNDELSVTKYPLYKSNWRGAGVALPVFGLRTNDGMGVGEFLDIKQVADWCSKTRMKVLQLLPITDTTCFWDERDSYPYSSISVVALHPMYLRVQAIKDIPANLKAEAEKEVKRFNDPKYFTEKQWDDDLNCELHRPVDYPNMINTKRKLMLKIYDAIGVQILDSADFKAFFKKSERWLRPYGVFCWLRDFFGTANHEEWGALGTGRVTKEKLVELSTPGSDLYKGVAFYWVMQYWLHVQLKEASTYCETKGVALKGDLPIGIDHDSVDAWFEPQFFNMDRKTGAPPDDYAQDGQNWGFPTYNWDEMEKDGFSWWRARLGAMEEYFHAYRIDHILGFFRIWQMPASTTGGLLGYFSPSLPLTRDELAREGFNDLPRLTEPYVKKHIMERVFGHEWIRVKERYFQDVWADTFKFKNGLESETVLTEIVRKEGSCIGSKQPKELLAGLKSFINNVVLVKDIKDPNGFHPRIECWKTASFQELDGGAQSKLRNMYQQYMYQRQEQFWADQSMRKLPAILDASRMLVCGEDLGMVPACVAGVLDKLGIMGLRIQRMPPDNAGTGKFGRPDTYPYMSVCTPSCHDMSTVAGWWEEDQGRRQHFWSEVLQRPGDAPNRFTDEVAVMVFKQHVWAPSCWAIFPIQDLLAMEHSLANSDPKTDQINYPPNPAHYWRWRCKASMEDILRNNNLNDKIKAIVKEAGRDGGY